ncbi:hypothetical protein BGX26_009708 [Mortierella sp. AD094]|nr:hypothetical protein BGX26_009708 [Mortierella sp. AD094]
MPDFIAPGLNPLEIPEIIAMVGQFVPISRKAIYNDPFNPTNFSATTVFAPKDLLACTAVSRTWRRILLPNLWRSYDGSLMRFVPLDVLQTNSVYFGSFRDQFGHYHSGPFIATNLRQLIISQQHDWAVPFMLSNQGLQHLTWTGLGRTILEKEYIALVGLANLRDLCLSNINISGRQLAVVLCSSPRLLRLSLSSIDGVQELDGVLILFALEEISLGFVPENSQCLLQLVQYCPSLQRLSFSGTWVPEQGRDLLKLSANIRCCCPDICSIQFAAAYCFGTDSFNTLEDYEYAALVQGAQSLTYFGADIRYLGHMLTTSLISQFDSLVAVDLCIRRRIQYQYPHDGGGGGASGDDGGNWNKSTQLMDVVNSARILSTCSHLRVFRLTSAEDVIGMETALEFFASPWACLGLEVLSLGHISIPAPTKKDRRSAPSTPSCSFGDYGWYAESNPDATFSSQAASKAAATTRAITSNGTLTPGATPPQDQDDDVFTLGSEFRQKLLPQVNVLTVLRELRLNKVRYARAVLA